MECYGDDDQFFMRHRKAPPSIDISILAGDASLGYALFDYGLTKDSSSFTISRVTISINVRILPKLIRYTFQSLSSLNKRLTVFQTCSPASALSAKNPPVLPSRLS